MKSLSDNNMRPQPAEDREVRARRHLAYRYMLRKCLRLSRPHAMALSAEWNCTLAYLRRLGFRSAPQSDTQKLFLEAYTAKEFNDDLRGVAGFYVELDEETLEPRWRLNAPPQKSILRPFKDEAGLIQGVLVYRNARDINPYLLSSRGRWLGSPAVQFDATRHH